MGMTNKNMKKATESFAEFRRRLEWKRFRRKLKWRRFLVRTFYWKYRYKCFDCGDTLEIAGKKYKSPGNWLRNGEPICAFCENDRFHSYEGYRELEDLEEALEEERLEIDNE